MLELHELREQIIRIKDDPSVPIVLVGNKADLEKDRAVPRMEAFELSGQWNDTPYFETSALNRMNIDEAFEDLCRQVMYRNMHATDQEPGEGLQPYRRPRGRKRDRCTIL